MDKLGSYEDKEEARKWGVTLSLAEILELIELILSERKQLRFVMDQGKSRNLFIATQLAKRIVYYEEAIRAWGVAGLGIITKRALDSRCDEFELPTGIYMRRGA